MNEQWYGKVNFEANIEDYYNVIGDKMVHRGGPE